MRYLLGKSVSLLDILKAGQEPYHLALRRLTNFYDSKGMGYYSVAKRLVAEIIKGLPRSAAMVVLNKIRDSRKRELNIAYIDAVYDLINKNDVSFVCSVSKDYAYQGRVARTRIVPDAIVRLNGELAVLIFQPRVSLQLDAVTCAMANEIVMSTCSRSLEDVRRLVMVDVHSDRISDGQIFTVEEVMAARSRIEMISQVLRDIADNKMSKSTSEDADIDVGVLNPVFL
ncbi:hypothetical protein CHU95_10145 [Niveispirillum lacus]|uniref:Uncharacterized protein n=1 Tax=Niveispirillum lacus TaxID=1981099 RepID=A0A255Z0I6_9PROT|nr:hypothetical protein [Niveispirillum lacus]OYQ34929.1 hypothetical protein CHU95_10145 [Niveispirillum lacus]